MNIFENNLFSSYCIVEFKSSVNKAYCLWYLDQNYDECFFTENNSVKAYECLNDITSKLDKYSIKYEFISFDLDYILTSFKNNNLDINLIIDFINIMTDVSKSCGKLIKEDTNFNAIYSKLFHALNLPAINTSNKKYIPYFNSNELLILKKHIEKCILFLNDNVFK